MPKIIQDPSQLDSPFLLWRQLLVGLGLFAAVALTIRDRASVLMISGGVGGLVLIIALLRRRDRSVGKPPAPLEPTQKQKPTVLNETFVKILRRTVDEIESRKKLKQNWDEGQTIFDRPEEEAADQTMSGGKSDFRDPYEPEWRSSDRILAQLPLETLSSTGQAGKSFLAEEAPPWNPDETDPEKIKEAMMAVLLDAPKDLSVFKIKRALGKEDSLFVPQKDQPGKTDSPRSPPKKSSPERHGNFLSSGSPKSEPKSDPKRSLRKQDMLSPKNDAPLSPSQKPDPEPPRTHRPPKMGTIWEAEESGSNPSTPSHR